MVLVTWPAAAGRRDAGCSVEEASGASGLGVGDGQRLDRLVGVEPARVGHDPQPGALDGLGLLARLRLAHPEGLAVGGDPRDGDDCRPGAGDGGQQAIAALAYGTERVAPVDVVVGLESGADDYVVKPVSPRVLHARIKAALRRPAPAALAALPVPLAALLPDPFGFRVAAASAFGGLDALGQLHPASDAAAVAAGPRDRFAARLANALGSHGPALISAMRRPSCWEA